MPPLKRDEFWSKTTQAESKGDPCSLQPLQHSLCFSIFLFFFWIPLYSIHFISPHFFSKRLDRESGAFPPSRWSINIQQSPEIQTGERLRRTAQHQSIMDFLLSFIRFLQGDGVEATLPQKERGGGGQRRRERKRKRESDRERKRERYQRGETERPTETQNSPQEYFSHLSLEGLHNICFNML